MPAVIACRCWFKWPGVIKPGTIYNDVVAHNDWMPTFAEAAGASGVKEKLANGTNLHGKDFKVHLGEKAGVALDYDSCAIDLQCGTRRAFDGAFIPYGKGGKFKTL